MSEISEKTVPDDFKKIINDFYRDILRTFPEYSENIDENIEKILNGEMENNYFLPFSAIYNKDNLLSV